MNSINKKYKHVSAKINGIFNTAHISTELILIIGLFIIN